VTRPVFVCPAAALERPGVVLLDGDEGRHAARVRRLAVGEAVDLTDGAGRRGTGVVASVGSASLEVAVATITVEPEPSPRLVVVQALPKGDRAEQAVELLSEVGADAVVPWAAHRCVTRWEGERGAKALARWRAHAREAGKQARRARHLTVADPVGLEGVARLLGAATVGLVLPEEADAALAVALPRIAAACAAAPATVVLVVGPEGGIDDAERARLAAVADEVRLGPSVLRTSTAGGVAAALVLGATGRWSTERHYGE
jgi:16S rRNA (uracil1498-N3)-methyltransferase